MGSNNRITIPADLSPVARDSERRFAASGSEVRRTLPLRAVPWLVKTHDELRSLPLDPREGFVLSLVDGRFTVEMILDVCGLPEDEAIDVMRKLVDVGAIELHTS